MNRLPNRMNAYRRRPHWLLFWSMVAMTLLVGAIAWAQGGATGDGESAYRVLFDADSPMGWMTPRVIVWIFAQLHLLFAAFVLAVPMFVLIMEVISMTTKDEARSKQFDGVAYEFTRLLTTAFSVTSIVGAIFTFCCIGMYPKVFAYLADVFGPSMYLYACIFFGESFSLYLYYYGWGKFSKSKHLAMGISLNVFGITLMLIANAWTTFMMAPGGVDPATGAILDRSAAFWNFLLHPINIHRLIANLCMGGSVAAAYAAYKFLTAKDDETRARYDWMGYIGNFVAILALLPLPFAGYYLGYEIYQYDQTLGIYMMGGVLSWLFVMQAVLIGALFFAANYYLWLGMDRIPGAERYRSWVKFLLGVVTLCVLVWATPKSISAISTSAELSRMGGSDHPFLSYLGVMSAKNTAVNLIILTTFLSFLLYRRGNKIPVVSWAKQGTMIQASLFGIAAAIVIVIGIGGYIPSMWLESTKRVAMSPYQVLAVLGCILLVMPIDILLLRGAKEIGPIKWGKTPRAAQYTLFFLAVSFTWLMGLMGFVRSSLRQHWHVYNVVKDTSDWAFTPALGPATVIVTIVVMLFFALVAMVIWIAELGSKEKEVIVKEPLTDRQRLGRLAGAVAAIALVVFGLGQLKAPDKPPGDNPDFTDIADNQSILDGYNVMDPELQPVQGGQYSIPLNRAMSMVASDHTLLNPTMVYNEDEREMTSEQRGELLFSKGPCSTCHTLSGEGKAPPLGKRWGKPTSLDGGEEVTFDAEYIRRSILEPQAQYAKGYGPTSGNAAMTVVPVTDQQIDDLIAFLQAQ